MADNERSQTGGEENLRTAANAVTLLRLVAATALFAASAYLRDPALNLAGLAVYWLGDVADGFLARRLDQETLFGAQWDILADRLSVAFFYLNYLVLYPSLAPVIVLFLVQFMVVDHYLSNQYLRWPIMSPNYFYKGGPQNLGAELVETGQGLQYRPGDLAAAPHQVQRRGAAGGAGAAGRQAVFLAARLAPA
jgi:hypothetical protein